MQEWLNWHAWKACVLQNGTEGSNPSLSASKKSVGRSKKYCAFNLYIEKQFFASPGGNFFK